MKKALIISLVFLLYGCINKNKDITIIHNSCLIQINLNSKKEKYENYFQYDSYIALETTDTSLIQQIDRLEFFNDTIFILDSRQASLFIFDRMGQFISKINNRGPSPREYISANDFFISESNRIYIYDGMQGALLLYDFQGSYIDKIKVEKGYTFTKLPDNNWLFYLGNGLAKAGENMFNNVLIYNENFELISEILPFNKYMQGLRHTSGSVKSAISIYNDTTYILPLLSNIIFSYCIEPSRMQSVYTIFFIDKQNEIVDIKMSPHEIENNIKKINEGIIPSRINNFYKIRNMVFFSFSYEKTRWLCLYKELEQKSILCEATFDENGLFFYPTNYFSNKKDEKIVSILDGDKFYICKNLDNKNNPIIQDINNSINGVEDANPILVFYTLK